MSYQDRISASPAHAIDAIDATSIARSVIPGLICEFAEDGRTILCRTAADAPVAGELAIDSFTANEALIRQSAERLAALILAKDAWAKA
jgi:hypothetical protein